eukprot:2499175-Amphidinium_carterae.1
MDRKNGKPQSGPCRRWQNGPHPRGSVCPPVSSQQSATAPVPGPRRMCQVFSTMTHLWTKTTANNGCSKSVTLTLHSCCSERQTTHEANKND